jgi:hypothetical protein
MAEVFGWFSDLYEEVKYSVEYRLAELELGISEELYGKALRMGVDLKSLGRKIGISEQCVRDMLGGGGEITLRQLVMLADALGCVVDVGITSKGGRDG